MKVVHEPIEVSRCTGSCCTSFWIPKWIFTDPEEIINKHSLVSDIRFIRDMIIIKDDSKPDQLHCSCKHFDSIEKKCSVYELRPQICRKYPENEIGDSCIKEDCTRYVIPNGENIGSAGTEVMRVGLNDLRIKALSIFNVIDEAVEESCAYGFTSPEYAAEWSAIRIKNDNVIREFYENNPKELDFIKEISRRLS